MGSCCLLLVNEPQSLRTPVRTENFENASGNRESGACWVDRVEESSALMWRSLLLWLPHSHPCPAHPHLPLCFQARYCRNPRFNWRSCSKPRGYGPSPCFSTSLNRGKDCFGVQPTDYVWIITSDIYTVKRLMQCFWVAVLVDFLYFHLCGVGYLICMH